MKLTGLNLNLFTSVVIGVVFFFVCCNQEEASHKSSFNHSTERTNNSFLRNSLLESSK